MNGNGGFSRRWRTAGTAGAAVLLAGLTACYPGEISSVDQTDVVVTLYDEDFDYAGSRTFAIPDTVVEVCDLANDPNDTPISCDEDSRIDYDHQFDQLYVDSVRASMLRLGYDEIPFEEISESNRPDVVMLAMVAVNEWTAYSYYPWYGYWGWWGGWGYYPGYGPGWGGYYPGYITTTKWQQGTLFVDMIDAEGVDVGQEQVPTVWSGAVNGVLSSSATSNRDRALRGIGQMFTQSAAYLGSQ